MVGTCVADKDLPYRHFVTSAANQVACINCVGEVNAATNCVELDDLETHDGYGGNGLLDGS